MEILEKLKEKVNLEEQNFLLSENESSKVEMDNGKLKRLWKTSEFQICSVSLLLNYTMCYYSDIFLPALSSQAFQLSPSI